MEFGLAAILCIICFIIGLTWGEHRKSDEHYKRKQMEEQENEEKIQLNKQQEQREKEYKKEDIKNIKTALKNLSLKHTIHHCEGVYAMLKSKYLFIAEGKELEKQIYSLLIKEDKK